MNRRREEPGQESVWDYPRPPRSEHVNEKVEVVFGGGWITPNILGPFKGGPGTWCW